MKTYKSLSVKTLATFLFIGSFMFLLLLGTQVNAQDINIPITDSLDLKAPHNGKLELNGVQYLEMVTGTKKLAFYLYDINIKPVSTKAVKGTVLVSYPNKANQFLALKAIGQNGFTPGAAVLNSFSHCKVTLKMKNKTVVYSFKNTVPNLIQYTCPTHPDIVKNEPGQCPKCGLDLVERKEMAKNP
jgi:hypothetical protein